MLDRLKLTAIRDQLDTLLDEAARSEMSLREALAFHAGREIARRDKRRIGMASSPIGYSDPDIVWSIRLQQDAGTIIRPQPCALRLPLWHLQPLLAQDPLNALLVHQPAGTPQQCRDPPVAVAAILPSQGDDVGRQRRLIIRCPGRLALRRPRLPQHAASKPLRHAELGHSVLHTIPATRRA